MSFSLFFDYLSAPTKKGFSRNEREPSAGHLQQAHSELLSQELGPWQMMPLHFAVKQVNNRTMIECSIRVVLVLQISSNTRTKEPMPMFTLGTAE